MRIRHSRDDLHAAAVTRITGDVLLSFGKWQVARIQEVVSAVWETHRNLLQHSKHVARNLLLRVAVVREVAVSSDVAVHALNAKRRVKRWHHFQKVHIGCQDTEIAGRRRGRLSVLASLSSGFSEPQREDEGKYKRVQDERATHHHVPLRKRPRRRNIPTEECYVSAGLAQNRSWR
jgi:hypothetical protein